MSLVGSRATEAEIDTLRHSGRMSTAKSAGTRVRSIRELDLADCTVRQASVSAGGDGSVVRIDVADMGDDVFEKLDGLLRAQERIAIPASEVERRSSMLESVRLRARLERGDRADAVLE